jgi:hypothetical protein
MASPIAYRQRYRSPWLRRVVARSVLVGGRRSDNRVKSPRYLSPRTRKLLIGATAVETVLKVFMLVDLRRRRPSQVRGSKRAWTAATMINSAGLVPLGYFVFGRRRAN